MMATAASRYYGYNNVSPVRFRSTEDRYEFVNTSTGEVVAWLDKGVDFGHEDVFVAEAFRDGGNITVIIMYGLEWRGTWASPIHLKHLVVSGAINDMASGVYIYRWIDEDGDSIPTPGEVEQVYP